ncbi:MAG TPA: 2-dehydropantoate 2-reductase [Propionibacteriaceae bacterium]|nr:2-dehydropantoate 2-reductase [Propionibacteriaceae bacterium]
MRVRLVGLGAIGAAYGSRMAAGAADFAVIAEADRAQRYREQPTWVNGVEQRFPLVLPQAAEPVELIVVAVKAAALRDAIELMHGWVGEGTVILSLLNGIDSEQILAEAFPEAFVPLALSVGIDAVREGRHIRYNSLGRIVFGAAGTPDEAQATSLTAVSKLFARVGIDDDLRTDMVHQLWWKFLINVGVNQVSAVLGAPYGAFQTEGAPARAAMLAAQAEVVAVAQAEGVMLTQADVESWLEVLSALGPDKFTSMAQDTLTGRDTEVDIFSGRVCELGRAHGIATPVNELLGQLLRAQPTLPPRRFGI